MAIESSSGNGIGNTLNYGKWGGVEEIGRNFSRNTS
jgi:hypothetical protein